MFYTMLTLLSLGLDQPLDPALWNVHPLTPEDLPQVDSGPCSCLSVVYLTLTDLQSVTTFSFPQVIIPLRKAMNSLSDLINCPQCPRDAFTAIQNIQSVVALFKAIMERFNKVLLEVDAEAERLQATGQKKAYRIGDNNPALYHMHTGSLDCPMGFNIELEAADWKRLVKAALKTEVYGSGSNQRPLMHLLKETEERQHKWHTEKEFWTAEKRQLFGGHGHDCDNTPKSCETLGAEHIRKFASNMNWT
jgi:hypothetical protein